MNNLFLLAVHNTVLALGFAVFVYGLTRVWRSPPVAHALWVLVLLKLAAPPVMRVDWRALPLPGSTHARGWVIPDVARIEGQTAEDDPRFPDRPAAKTAGQTPDLNVNAYDFAASLRLLWDRGRAVLPWV